MADYLERLTDALLVELLAGLPAVLIVGPRATGKTTTALHHARTVVRLDRADEAGPVRDAPDAVLATLDEPVLLDEWQAVPDVLGAVKRSVDGNPRSGAFILTGSVRAELLEASWAATGRVVRVAQWGLTQRELRGRVGQRSIVDVLFDGDVGGVAALSTRVDVRDYIDMALRGGFPEVARQESVRARGRWFDSYIDQLVMRDSALHQEDRDPTRLRRYLRANAASTASVVSHKTLYDAAGIKRNTGTVYDALLELLFVMELVPAWHSNQLNRLTRRPKRYLTDPALAAALLGLNERSIIRSADLLGAFIDTFIAAQLRPELEVADTRARFAHLRLDDGSHEVDLLLEAADGRIVGLELKATASPTEHDARHLVWLRDRLGEQFVAGVVFHTGPRPLKLAERIWALPIASVWDH